MNSTTFYLAALGVIIFALMMMWANNQDTMRENLEAGCAKTDLRVYVGGRVGKVLAIYDCSGAPK